MFKERREESSQDIWFGDMRVRQDIKICLIILLDFGKNAAK